MIIGKHRHLLTSLFAREAIALGAAIAIACLVVLHLSLSERSWLIYFDGDSMLPALVQASLSSGERQAWALSSPLFIPEMTIYLGIGSLHLPVSVTLTLNAIVNWIAFYAALRFLAGASRDHRSSQYSLAAFTVFGTMALLESSGNRNSLEDASLLSTGTYYSATVIGSVFLLAIVARLWHQPARPIVLLFAGAGVACVST